MLLASSLLRELISAANTHRNLGLLAKRWLALEVEVKTVGAMLENLTTPYAPRLRGRFGVGPQTATVLVAVAGDNPERLKSEASLAELCGVSPV